MTALNLLSSLAVDVSPTTITAFSGTPTVSSYGTWVEAGRCEWVALPRDIITITLYVVTSISSVVSTTDDSLTVYARQRLFDESTGLEVPAGTKTCNIFQTIDAASFGSLTNITNFNETFVVGAAGLLIANHSYSLKIEVMKEQSYGTPTCDLVINDSSAFSAAAVVLSK